MKLRESEPRVSVYRKDYQAPPYLVETVDLTLLADAASTVVRSSLRICRNPVGQGGPLRLDGRELRLEQLLLDGRTLSPDCYQLDDQGMEIAVVPERFELFTECRIHPQDNTALEGLYQSADFLLSQCEPEGFRKITYFPDRPDVMARYRVRIEADRTRYPQLLSNGNCVERGDLQGGRHFAVWEDPFPKPSYLFAVVAGRLEKIEDEFVTAEDRRVTLRIYAEAENIGKLDHAMASLKKAMRWDEDRFGLCYDLDIYNIVATNDFNMGAMENKSLNIFNSKYLLASPETATDEDYQAIEGVIGHEYFHNWTGNRVTCRDWFQLSLKEGLTVFRDQEFSSDMQSRAVKRIQDVRALRTLQYEEDRGPMAHPVRPDSYMEINNFYTLTVYEKGAEVVRMYHTLLGEEGFQRGMRLYFERHDGQAVTCDDFRRAMADANGADLDQFGLWYSQAGTPLVKVAAEYDERRHCLVLDLAQHTPATAGQARGDPLHIPLRLALLDGEGREMPLQLNEGRLLGDGDVLELTQARQRFTFTGVTAPPVLSLFRGFSAPVTVDYPRSLGELAFLMGHDGDPFNRWDASQELATRVILEDARRLQAREPCRGHRLYLKATRAALADSSADPALIAAALTQPHEALLAGQVEPVPVDELNSARRGVRRLLADALADELQARYRELRAPAYSAAPAAVAGRTLKNVCLQYLVEGGDNGTAQDQYRRADNMSDAIAALCALSHAGVGEAQMADFYRRWRSDPLVMDKWLMVQAADPRPGAVGRVEALLADPVFALRNPNKVRALIGTFARLNPPAFHAADGGGYALVAAQVLAIDRFNPQMAARLVVAFNSWRRYDPSRRSLMRGHLEAIRADRELSKDVYEIVSKALQGDA